MTVTKTIEGSRMEITLAGKFDTISAPQFEAEISNQLEGINEVIIDMKEVEYISSAGLRSLLFVQKTMDKVKGTLSVRNVSEIVMNVFGITNFTDFVKVI